MDRAYATVQGPNVLAVVDGATNQVIAEPPVGALPQGVDSNLINNKVYVANSQSSSVTIVDGTTNQVLQTLPVPAAFPTALSVNQANGLTYVSDFGSDKVIVLQPN
jgi:YVTN family beta-propeller protein